MALLHLQLLDKPEMLRKRYAMLLHPILMLFVLFFCVYNVFIFLRNRKGLMNASTEIYLHDFRLLQLAF